MNELNSMTVVQRFQTPLPSTMSSGRAFVTGDEDEVKESPVQSSLCS
jgi:hypothetical protein